MIVLIRTLLSGGLPIVLFITVVVGIVMLLGYVIDVPEDIKEMKKRVKESYEKKRRE